MDEPTADTAQPIDIQDFVDHTIDASELFDELAVEVADRAALWPEGLLYRWLTARGSDVDARNRALVALALKASARAGQLLDRYEPGRSDRSHRTLYQLARIEWEHRFEERRRWAA